MILTGFALAQRFGTYFAEVDRFSGFRKRSPGTANSKHIDIAMLDSNREPPFLLDVAAPRIDEVWQQDIIGTILLQDIARMWTGYGTCAPTPLTMASSTRGFVLDLIMCWSLADRSVVLPI